MFKKRILYLLSIYSIQGINILLNLLFMKYLSVIQLGDLALAKTWQQSVDYSHAGTRFSLDRYIPVADEIGKKQLVSAVINVTVVISSCLFTGSMFFSRFNTVIVTFTFVGFMLAMSNIIKAYLRASGEIDRMLFTVIICQLLPVMVSTLIFVVSENFNTYLLGYFLSFVISMIALFFCEKKLFITIFQAKMDLIQTLKSILKPSALLFLNALLIFLYMVMDRFFVDHYLGRQALGDYSIITFAFTALMIIPATFAELIFTKIIRQSVQAGKKLFLPETLLCVGVTLLAVIIANIVMALFIKNFTHYEYLISDIRLATFAVIPFSVTAVYFHVLNGHDLRQKMLSVSFTVCLLQMAYFYMLVLMSSLTVKNFIYAKLATGWIVMAGYFLIIMLHSFKDKASS